MADLKEVEPSLPSDAVIRLHVHGVGTSYFRDLVEAGVSRERIDVVPGCTACGGRLFSHRRSGGALERHGLCAVLV